MTLTMHVYGSRALLVEADRPEQVLPLAAAVHDVPGVVEIVPAARTVLLRFTDAAAARSARERLADLDLDDAPVVPPATGAGQLVLDVDYDGPDLDAVAAELGRTPDDVVRLHSEAAYVVAFCGFAPGFAYLRGLPGSLHVPRLAEPRSRVPSGSVGIADEFTGVYPRSSPGGWRLLGRTAAPLWDSRREPPALLTPGATVRFRPT
jgi:KipI family sensor histidine kinase inhibitor